MECCTCMVWVWMRCPSLIHACFVSSRSAPATMVLGSRAFIWATLLPCRGCGACHALCQAHKAQM